MARFCRIYNNKDGYKYFDAVKRGDTVMYCVDDLYVIGFATVVNKELIERAIIKNGEIQSTVVDPDLSNVTVIPYGCTLESIHGKFNLHIGEFKILSPDDDNINADMLYVLNRCQGI